MIVVVSCYLYYYISFNNVWTERNLKVVCCERIRYRFTMKDTMKPGFRDVVVREGDGVTSVFCYCHRTILPPRSQSGSGVFRYTFPETVVNDLSITLFI